MFDNVYKIYRCDMCNEEIREKYLGPNTADTYSSQSFQRIVHKIVYASPDGQVVSKSLCPACAYGLVLAFGKTRESITGGQ